MLLTSVPTTYRWSPFFSLSAAYSARPFHTTMRCHSVFSWRCSSVPVHQVFVASERIASVRPAFFVDLLSGFLPKKPISSTLFSYICDSPFCPCNWGTRKREGSAPKSRVCISGGAQKLFDAVREEFLGGNGKAEDTKSPGAGSPPKPCPMERVKWRPWTKWIELGFGETGSTIH